MRSLNPFGVSVALCVITGAALLSCGSKTTDPVITGPAQTTATVRIKNDFNNAAMDRKPPWTICKCSYRGKEFGKILLGDSSTAIEVEPGLDYVLIVAAWSDTACSTQNCLPIASKIEEEVVAGQTRTIVLNAPNHQGPCPPLGVEPIPETLYNRILALYPLFGFKPYTERAQNPQCIP